MLAATQAPAHTCHTPGHQLLRSLWPPILALMMVEDAALQTAEAPGHLFQAFFPVPRPDEAHLNPSSPAEIPPAAGWARPFRNTRAQHRLVVSISCPYGQALWRGSVTLSQDPVEGARGAHQQVLPSAHGNTTHAEPPSQGARGHPHTPLPCTHCPHAAPTALCLYARGF